MQQTKTWFYAILLTLIGLTKLQSQTTYTPSIAPDSLHAWRCANENLSPSKYNFVATQNNTFRTALLPTPANFVIPVVVHVLYDAAHANDPAFNISYQQIQWQISALNTGFQNFYGSGMPRATNTQIQFCLAQTPMGPAWTSSTQPGIMRYQVATSVLNHTVDVPGQNALLGTTHTSTVNFPTQNYLNIWLVNSITDTTGLAGGGTPNSNIIGYSNFPNTLSATNLIDGIVIRNYVFGSNLIPNNQNVLFSGLDQGGILVHEAGHYLNLLHTFQGSLGGLCAGSTSTNCAVAGDLICDTPPTQLLNIAVCTVTSTCTDNLPVYGTDQNDFVNNFMCYSDDNCLNAFTADQSTVMQGVLSTAWPTGRQDMTSAANLAATGLTGSFGCCPTGVLTAYFTTTVTSCSAVTYSVPLPPCAMNANYLWHFGDGSTLTATTNTATHTYSLAGQYTPTLTVTNGTNTTEWYKVIEVGTYGKSSAKTVCNNSLQGVNFHVQTIINAGTYTMTTNFNGATTSHVFNISAFRDSQYGHARSVNVEDQISIALSPTVTLPAQIIYTVTITGTGGVICNTTFIDTFNVINCCNNLITNGNFSGTGGYTTPSGVQPGTPPWLVWPYNPSLNFDSPTCGIPPSCTSKVMYDAPFNIQASNNYQCNWICMGGNPTYLMIPTNVRLVLLDTVTLNPRILDSTGAVIHDFGNIAVMDICDTTWHHYNFVFNSGTHLGTAHFNLRQVKSLYSADAVTNFGLNYLGWGYDYVIDEVNVRAVSNLTTAITPSLSSICSALQSTLVATAAGTYTWSTGSSNDSIFVTPSVTTIYSIAITSSLNCSASASATLNVVAGPTVAVTPTAVTICTGNSTILSASGAHTYTWSTTAHTASISVSPSVTTTYTVVGTNTVSGCTDSKTITVTVNQTPTVAVNSSSICSGSTATLTAVGATTYTWSTTATTSTIAVSPTVTTSYTVTGTKTSCTNSAVATVTVNPNPTVTAVANPTSICVGQTSTLTAGGATTYSWSTTSTNTVITVTPSTTTTYTVRGFFATGCTSTKTISVLVGPVTPTITASASSVAVCSGGSATLSATGAINYTWMPGGYYTSSVSITPTVATIFTLSANSGTGGGCNTATTTLLVNPIISTLCCSAATSTVGTSLTGTAIATSGTFTTSTAVVYIQGIVTFTGNTSYTGYTFRMAAGAKLIVEPNKTLTLINCKLYSCSELWDGIYLKYDGTSYCGNLIATTSTLEDMYNGIVQDFDGNVLNPSVPSGTITLSGSKLNKNYYSVQIRNTPGYSTGSTYLFGMTSSSITTAASSTSPGSSLKPSSTYTYAYNTITNGSTGSSAPYVNFPRSFTGINGVNLGYLTALSIGSIASTSLTNTFDNMDFGISCTEVYTKVQNNYFKNITGSPKSTDPGLTPPPPAQGPDEIGIAVVVTQTASLNYNTVQVGGNAVLPTGSNPFPRGNKFEDCNKGIKIYNTRYATVKGNVFTSTNTSTVVVTTSMGLPIINPNTYYYYTGQTGIWNAANADNSQLSYNFIRNQSTGIYSSITVTLSAGGQTNISNNDIGAPNSTGYCLQAIQIEQSGGNNLATDMLAVTNNTIANVYRGIIGNNVLSGLLIYNQRNLTIESPAKTLAYTATQERTGITLNGCQYASVKGNSILSNASSIPTSTNTARYENGIYITNSINGKIECNATTHLGRDFVFRGTSDNRWLDNNMSDSYTGLEFYLSGRFGTQGAPSGSPGSPNLAANTWTTITQETNVLASSNVNTNSIQYLQANGAGLKTQPTTNAGAAGMCYTVNILQGIRVVPGTSYTCNANGSANRMANGNNTNSVSGSNKKIASVPDSLTDYINLANTDENTSEIFTDEFIFINKQLVYKLIEQDSINPIDGGTLDNFYEANQNTAIDKLTEVQNAIANNDLDNATNSNASVPVTNQVEYKHQKANELVLKYLSDRFYQYTSEEKQELYNMANECIVKGYYVVQARNVLNLITNQIIQYNDECEAEANASRKAKPLSNKVSTPTSFLLFPNPNNGNMELNYDLGNANEATMNVYDVTGKLVNTYKLQNTKGTMPMNEQKLHNGIYFYHILVGEKVIKTDKIVIIK